MTDAQLALLSKPEMEEATFLYHVLIQVCEGKALNILKLESQPNGYSAWKHLMKEYEPDNAVRLVTMLSPILNPTWDARKPYLDTLAI